ncbi:MAG: MaoC family dehydratase N-terminal domain-containing protein [Microbacteriaceae bacterium]|nr:MaoC family dehydratase N-terminal domain-containing protein [Microbacteriaceae bacterium]
MVSESIVGKTYKTAKSYLVGREKLIEFAKAIHSTNPALLDADAAQAAGLDDVVGPATFSVVMQQQVLNQFLADPDVGIDFANVVHGEQKFEYLRQVKAGDLLDAVLTVNSYKAVGTNVMLGAETVITSGGEPVITATSMLFVRNES